MDTVMNKNNETIFYSIFQFQRMSDEVRKELSELIVCEECKGKAYYRRETRDGKQACFCAKHEDGCKIASRNTKKEFKGEEEVSSIVIDDSEFMIRWNYPTKDKAKNKPNGDCNDNDYSNEHKSRGKIYIKIPPITRKGTITMSQILNFQSTIF